MIKLLLILLFTFSIQAHECKDVFQEFHKAYKKELKNPKGFQVKNLIGLVETKYQEGRISEEEYNDKMKRLREK